MAKFIVRGSGRNKGMFMEADIKAIFANEFPHPTLIHPAELAHYGTLHVEQPHSLFTEDREMLTRLGLYNLVLEKISESGAHYGLVEDPKWINFPKREDGYETGLIALVNLYVRAETLPIPPR